MSTKILVYKDEAQIEKTIYCLQEFTPKLNVLLQEYERLKIGKFSNESFKQLKEDKGENAVKLYYESVNKELDKNKVIVKEYDEIASDLANLKNKSAVAAPPDSP